MCSLTDSSGSGGTFLTRTCEKIQVVITKQYSACFRTGGNWLQLLAQFFQYLEKKCKYTKDKQKPQLKTLLESDQKLSINNIQHRRQLDKHLKRIILLASLLKILKYRYFLTINILSNKYKLKDYASDLIVECNHAWQTRNPN